MNDYEFNQLIDKIISEYKGDGTILSAALGVLVLSRAMGWKAVSLMHSERTIRNYQTELGVIFKEICPERGKYAGRSLGLFIVDKLDNFWQVLQGRDKRVSRKERTLLQ